MTLLNDFASLVVHVSIVKQYLLNLCNSVVVATCIVYKYTATLQFGT